MCPKDDDEKKEPPACDAQERRKRGAEMAFVPKLLFYGALLLITIFFTTPTPRINVFLPAFFSDDCAAVSFLSKSSLLVCRCWPLFVPPMRDFASPARQQKGPFFLFL